jgi:hypothetical protein
MNSTVTRRPWGTYQTLSQGNNYHTKLITVDPGQRLSYQTHSKRSEHWIILSGYGTITLEDQEYPCGPNQHFHIPTNAKHRIANNHPADVLTFIEVQTGTYFGEDDIVRIQDDYNR